MNLELEDLKPRLLGVTMDSTEELLGGTRYAEIAFRRCLMIVGIVDGVLKKFNEKFPRQAVKNFDKITAVNGKSGSANDMRRPNRA